MSTNFLTGLDDLDIEIKIRHVWWKNYHHGEPISGWVGGCESLETWFVDKGKDWGQIRQLLASGEVISVKPTLTNHFRCAVHFCIDKSKL